MGYRQCKMLDKSSLNFEVTRGFEDQSDKRISIMLSADIGGKEFLKKDEAYAGDAAAQFIELADFWLRLKTTDMNWVPHSHIFSEAELAALLDDFDQVRARVKAGKVPAKTEHGWI